MKICKFLSLFSDLPDCEKNPVLLLNVNRVGTPNRTVAPDEQLNGKDESHHIHPNQKSPQLQQQEKRPRPKTLVLDTKNQYNKDEVDKRSSLGVFYKDKSFYDIKTRPSRQSTKNNNNNNSSKKSNFYIELSPPDYYNINANCEAYSNSIKIGQTTSTNTQSSFDNNSDRNSNGKPEEAFLQHHISSFEINKNNKIHDRRENLTKKNSFEANDDSTTTITKQPQQQQTSSSPLVKQHNKPPPPPKPPTSNTSSSNQTTPKVLITRIKKTNNHREEIENILIDQQPRSSTITTTTQHLQQSSSSTTPHHTNSCSNNTATKKKSSNCRIYGFIPKCAKRNDSTEPESLSEETNNNLDLLIRNNTLTINSKNSSLIMDRSIDSIGSCSLDVDADSTDFSGTSNIIDVCKRGDDFCFFFLCR